MRMLGEGAVCESAAAVSIVPGPSAALSPAALPATVVLAEAARSVAARFGAAACTYDEQSLLQRTVAERLMTLIDGCGTPSRILDVGCGTGTLTRLLRLRFPDAVIHAVDIAEGMIECARQRMGDSRNTEWRVADARSYAPGCTFSLVAGSSSLHWMAPLSHTIRGLASLLEPGGSFVSALMVHGTFPELQAARLRATPQKPVGTALPETGAVLESLEAAGLELHEHREELLQTSYDSAGAFLRSLNRQGVTGTMTGERQLLNRSELRQLGRDYDFHYAHPAGGVFATHRVLYFRARKSER